MAVDTVVQIGEEAETKRPGDGESKEPVTGESNKEWNGSILEAAQCSHGVDLNAVKNQKAGNDPQQTTGNANHLLLLGI